SSSRIFDLRAFSSGVRFFTGILLPSTVVSLFYTFAEVYTKFGMASFLVFAGKSFDFIIVWCLLLIMATLTIADYFAYKPRK
ncbi:hypothetical protein, partial [uncultured Agathobaculum sp.]|uniref:hypothetical protein n=1 Tax=uncultured Agathobaculum sp. TaxID=2048140 RepID=UPI00296E76E8